MKFEVTIEVPTTKRAWVIFFSRQVARLHSVLQQALVTYVEYDEVDHKVVPTEVDHKADPEVIDDPLWPEVNSPPKRPCVATDLQTVVQVLYGPYYDQSAWCGCERCQLKQASCS
jgi:hypothetical protein